MLAGERVQPGGSGVFRRGGGRGRLARRRDPLAGLVETGLGVVERRGGQRRGQRGDRLLAHRARLSRDEVRAQAGHDVRPAGLVGVLLTLLAIGFG